MSDLPATAAADPGSFRDPTSRVWVGDTGVWRTLDATALADYRALAATTFFETAVADGTIVGTRERATATPTPSAGGTGDWAGVIEHERIPVISYPYEWSFEMLRQAALCQLDLTRRALAEGLITKDATPYNIQFVGTRPVFIDVGSFEQRRANEPWAGYRQFCELFLYPLLVQALRDVPFQPFLRGHLDGLSPQVAADLLRGVGRFRRGMFTHVRLHARAQRRYADADREHDVRGELTRAGFSPALIDAQLRNLTRMVSRLRWRRSDSTWSSYSERGHYVGDDLADKDGFVQRAVAHHPGGVVLDLGANDGRFSRLALAAGAGSVVAVDNDDLVIDRLYRTLRQEDEARILPLVLDLADPSGGIGWRQQERAPFVDRVRPDLVLCLAVVHHLALTNNVPLDGIVAFLADFGAPLVVEFPHPDDVMASRLLQRKREHLFDGYGVDAWEHALAARFQIEERHTLAGGTRTLYRCSPTRA